MPSSLMFLEHRIAPLQPDIIVASGSGEFGDLPGFRASFERKPAQLVLNILRGRGTGRLLMQ